jgi:hypothetical protein
MEDGSGRLKGRRQIRRKGDVCGALGGLGLPESGGSRLDY